MSAPVEIIRLVPGQGARLRAVRLEALRQAPEAFCTTYAESAAYPAEKWEAQLRALPTFVAMSAGQDGGLARGSKSDRAGVAMLMSMWVAPSLRGRGVATMLIETVADWARGEDCHELALDVRDDNVAAIALYHRLGFRPTGQRGTSACQIGEHEMALTL